MRNPLALARTALSALSGRILRALADEIERDNIRAQLVMAGYDASNLRQAVADVLVIERGAYGGPIDVRPRVLQMLAHGVAQVEEIRSLFDLCPSAFNFDGAKAIVSVGLPSADVLEYMAASVRLHNSRKPK